MGEQIAGGRVAALIAIAADMKEIRTLSGLVEELQNHIEEKREVCRKVLEKFEADIKELEEQLEFAQSGLTETSERLDQTMKEMFLSIPAAPEKTPRTKKAAKEAAAEAVKEFVGAGSGLVETLKESQDLGFIVSNEDVVADRGISEGTNKAEDLELESSVELPAKEVDPEEKTEPAEDLGQGYTDGGPNPDYKPEAERLTFEPLDAPLGECELCQGWGVIDGELYGEFALVPCTCKAGKAVEQQAPPFLPISAGYVAGDPQEENQAADVQIEVCPGARACSDYAEFLKNPGTQYPPPAALVGIPCYLCGKQRPANCTGCPYRFECELDPETLDCREVQEGIQEMKAGAIEPPVLNLDLDSDWPDAPGAKDNQAEPENVVTTAAPEPSPLQKKCPHPKPFRKEIEGVGIVCEVCKLTLEPIAVTESAFEKNPDCCKPQRRRADVDEVTGNRVFSCMDCGTIHRIQNKDGEDLPLDSQGVPWQEDGPDMAPEARGDKARNKKKSNAQE